MKNKLIYSAVFASLVLFGFSSCTEQASDTTSTEETTEASPLITKFLEDVYSLENEEANNPIEKFSEVAVEAAAKTMSLDQGSIKDVLAEAANYKYLVIVVGNHTIVKIDDVTDCKDSGSWGACMPIGDGCVKKGKLTFQEDYINNIIGKPDNQERTAYFFK